MVLKRGSTTTIKKAKIMVEGAVDMVVALGRTTPNSSLLSTTMDKHCNHHGEHIHHGLAGHHIHHW